MAQDMELVKAKDKNNPLPNFLSLSLSSESFDRAAATRRRRRDQATTVRKSSDDDEIECILSHARRRRDRVTRATRSSDDEIEQESQLLDSNEFCTTLRLPGRVYEAGEPPDNPKAIIHYSKIDYVEKVEDILGKEEFSLIENSHIGSILKVVKRSRVQFSEELFHFLMQRRVLTQGEDLWLTFSDQPMRFSLREFHLTTGLHCEEDQTITEPQFKIMKKPYLWMLGKDDKFTVRTLYEIFKEKARSMPTLERVSLGTTIITEAVIMAENPSSKIPRDRLQRYMNYRLSKVAWGKTAYSILMRSVKRLSASSWTGDSYEVSTVIGLAEEYKHLVGATHSNDADFHSIVKLVQQGYKMKRSDWEQGFVDMFVATEDIGQQRKTKDEDAEHDCENRASSGDRRSAQDYENEENTIDEEANSGDKKSAPDDGNEEDTIAEEANSGDGRSALDDENEEEICDDEAKSGTEHLREEENILGENETTQKITQEEDTEKFVTESCLKQTSHVTSPTPTFTSPKFDLLCQESRHSGNGTNEVLMRDICEISVFQPLMKIKKRLVQQDNQVNEDVEPPFQKKIKADTDNVPLRISGRGPIPSIHTQPPFIGARKKHPILHPFEKLRINHEIVTAKWFSDIETSGKKLSKMHIEAGLELLKLRKINNPDLFLNKTALVVGVRFLEEIDELYDEFLGDKEVKEKYWVGVVVNLEKRSITAFNCAVMKFTDASLVPYINAYAIALPFMIRNFFKDVSMDTSMFSIKIVSEGFPQVPKIEDNGVYALKLIECHAMRIVDLAKLSEEKIAIIREKLAVDIFSELQ
uniref:Ubiquitin-like protease family profile domain-containing protein n=1 Tax=Brassica oleracea var. oleracea TaxID=109376 RepID=A0A0D3A821_BRAOL